MKDRFATAVRSPGIRRELGGFVALLIMVVGTLGVFATAVGLAYADSAGGHQGSGTPAFTNGSEHSNPMAILPANSVGGSMDGREPETDGANQQTAKPGVTVSSVSLVFPEGMNAVYDVVLDAAPSDDVTIDIAAESNTDVTVDPESLVFTTTDWSETKSVTVTGIGDTDTLTDRETIVHTVSGGGYDDVEVESVQVFVTEACDALWCGIMEVEKVRAHELQMVGLDNTAFMDGGQTHQVGWTVLTTRVLPGEEAGPPFSIPERASLRFWLTGGLAGTGYYSNWTMYVNDVELPFSEARVVFDDLEGNTRLLFRWYAPGLNELFPTGHGAQGASWYLRIEDTGAPTPQPPGPPLYLRFVGTHLTSDQLLLLWSRPYTLDDYYHELTEFRVQWKRADGDWEEAADVSEAVVEPQPHATQGYRIEGLEGGFKYDVRVIAVNEVGPGEPSEVASATAGPAE